MASPVGPIFDIGMTTLNFIFHILNKICDLTEETKSLHDNYFNEDITGPIKNINDLLHMRVSHYVQGLSYEDKNTSLECIERNHINK